MTWNTFLCCNSHFELDHIVLFFCLVGFRFLTVFFNVGQRSSAACVRVHLKLSHAQNVSVSQLARVLI